MAFDVRVLVDVVDHLEELPGRRARTAATGADRQTVTALEHLELAILA